MASSTGCHVGLALKDDDGGRGVKPVRTEKRLVQRRSSEEQHRPRGDRKGPQRQQGTCISGGESVCITGPVGVLHQEAVSSLL